MARFVFMIAALGLPFGVASCGFTPLYAADTSRSLVSVDKIEGRTGHALRKALLQQLGAGLPGLEEPAQLTIILDERVARLALQPDEAATRSDFRVEAEYVLALEGDAISGKVEAETSFLAADQPFADIPAQIDAGERAMNVLAQRILADLRIKLANRDEVSG
ncbi:MAG: hypothetical protein AAGF20_10685 [Pseudomonadota bacterium]